MSDDWGPQDCEIWGPGPDPEQVGGGWDWRGDEERRREDEAIKVANKQLADCKFIANALKHIEGIVSHPRLTSDEKLCHMLLAALRSLHSAILFEESPDGKGRKTDHVVANYESIVDLLLLSLFKKPVNAPLLVAKGWTKCKKWALRILALVVELLPPSYYPSEEYSKRLPNELNTILKKDLKEKETVSTGNKEAAVSKREEIAIVVRILHRLVTGQNSRLAGNRNIGEPVHKMSGKETQRLFKELAFPLACKYVTYEVEEFLNEFHDCFTLKSELDLKTKKRDKAFAWSVHSSTMCLLVGLVQVIRKQAKLEADDLLSPYYRRVYQVVKSHESIGGGGGSGGGASSTKQTDAEQRELLVSLLVLYKLEVGTESRFDHQQLFTSQVLVPVFELSTGWLRARLYIILDRISATCTNKEFAKLTFAAHDDLHLCESSAQDSSNMFATLETCASYFLTNPRWNGSVKDVFEAYKEKVRKASKAKKVEVTSSAISISDEELFAWLGKLKPVTTIDYEDHNGPYF